MTMIFAAPWTRSIAPPMPRTILPGTIQLARSPNREISIAPRTATSINFDRIMPKDSEELKKLAPGTTVMVSLPALISSGSTSSSVGYGPTPRLTYCPSLSSAATRAAI